MSSREGFSEMIRFKMRKSGVCDTVPSALLVNMDKSAEFFEAGPKSTLHAVGDNTLSVRCMKSDSRIMTACVPVPCDGTKLP